jgi:hypothetical protein
MMPGKIIKRTWQPRADRAPREAHRLRLHRARDLGHRDIKLTLRYAHLAPGHLRSGIDKTEAPSAQFQHNVIRSSPHRP